MDTETVYTCSSCGKEIYDSGLCPECLKRHDRVVKSGVTVIWILAVISFGYYYAIFIH
ncbi:hypothetical protein [Desulfosporosinus youngiae]|uniref:hypothetical protein n=1 Tax=Desulfosporosinus youngiae TaxID=339862 RepID=UPI0012F49FC1|nr:hypothetical protein [Desulfosporosinus youngiae]